MTGVILLLGSIHSYSFKKKKSNGPPIQFYDKYIFIH